MTAAAEPLSTDRILSTALTLVETDGADAFSMRTLASRLDVTPMALYRWFANRDALLDALVERSLGEIHLPVSADGTWDDRVYRMVGDLRRHLLGHRALLALPSASRRLTAAVLHAADDGLTLVRELGRNDVETVTIFRSLVWHVFSFTLVVDAWAESDGTAAPASFRAVADAVDPERAPLFTSLADHFARFDADALFERSTRALIRGLRTDD